MSIPRRPNTFNEKVEDETPLSPMELQDDESREQANRLNDDLELLRAERYVSNQEHDVASRRSRDHRLGDIPEEDAFNQPVDEPAQATQPQKPTAANKLWAKVKKFPRVIRYFVYWLPVAAVLLAPIMIDSVALPDTQLAVGGAGGVHLFWFGIWLEIVWGTLWLSRITCATMPYLFKFCAKAVGSSNYKKWKDVGRDLELHASLFIWMLAVLCSFLPIVNTKRAVPADAEDKTPFIPWIDIVQKVIVSLFVLATLNIVEKILIQWIASSFHMRTYAYRIEANKRDIDFLISMYTYSRSKTDDDSFWNPTHRSGGSSGDKTPMKTLQENARQAWSRFGTVANRVAGDFTGRKVLNDNHPRRVVLELLRTTPSSQTLARMLFRAMVAPDRDTLVLDDFLRIFEAEEAEACFGIFDRDLNGDISMEELELASNEIHLEKKAIAASLKDLDSVIKKLDSVFVFIILIISIIVFISILSGSAAAALGSAGTTLLGLAWMLQATAQEFLQSIIFVFVKHPFDVGDRVRVYGNTGTGMQGDDYYVQEVSLLYTEFKKMEGHVVQAPNSLLNNLFILNQRRSNGLADPIELKVRFGTTNEVVEELKARMLDFVMENKRDYAPRIITEVRTIDEVWSVTINIIFFHKSSFQNELVRLNRHNKFAAELMRQMADLGIEGPRKHQPGGARDLPFFWSNVQPPSYDSATTYPTGGGGSSSPHNVTQ
ncbi:mechanosensitive ion channel family protein [Magnaporthiopsis poae ATCC 64411]|uniref:Mechanosensitive ion channel protein n=1 Tax=Magnaporthiopsis poae (strain ATCC 64411 / 73-15) TaxID=644358 RepID=A0A0C4EB31_MAGP6|nr:mechanosensitive ion channel family protein [Magnaporthiopsis poae ATCC 64411]